MEDLKIISSNFAECTLQSVEIKQSADGKTEYAVCQFVKKGLDELMMGQASTITIQILAPFGMGKEEAHAYLQKWEAQAATKSYNVFVGNFEIGPFEPFLRKDQDGKFIKSNGKLVVFKSLVISVFTDADGKPLRNNVIRRAQSRFDNSKRIMTVEAYKKEVEKQKAAKAAAEAATKTDDLLASAVEGDLEP